MITKLTLAHQTIEETELNSSGIEERYYNVYDVRDIEIGQVEVSEFGTYETTVTGVITWQGEHHIVEKRVVSRHPLDMRDVERDASPWIWTGEVVGYEPGVR